MFMTPAWLSPSPDHRRDSAERFASAQTARPRDPCSAEIWRDLHAGVNQAADRVDRLVEHRLLRSGELDLDHPLDALGAEHDGNADIEILHTVFAVEIGRAGKHAL